jgi:hypothetical protein
MEPELWTENEEVQESDDSLLVDFRPHLQAQILRAADRLHECRMVIGSQFTMNPYLHDAYVRAGNDLQSLIEKWDKYFRGEPFARHVFLADPYAGVDWRPRP